MPKTLNARPIVFNGHYTWAYSGQRVEGLDLNKVVRDAMRNCGYPCLKCSEPDCSQKDVLNPNIREELEALVAEVAALRAIVDANHP